MASLQAKHIIVSLAGEKNHRKVNIFQAIKDISRHKLMFSKVIKKFNISENGKGIFDLFLYNEKVNLIENSCRRISLTRQVCF